MLIAVISDTHDNEATIRLAFDYLRTLPVEALIHCGDISTPGTLALIAELFAKPIHVVFGNVDTDRDGFAAVTRQFPHITLHGETGQATLGGVALAFTHFPQAAETLVQSGKYRFVFHGHTHEPWVSRLGLHNGLHKEAEPRTKIDECTILNPGNLAGTYSKATFALVDLTTGKATLKLVERL